MQWIDQILNFYFRLIENTETMERSSRKLDQGRNLLEETQSVGASVLSDLENQRETLMRSRNRVSPKDLITS